MNKYEYLKFSKPKHKPKPRASHRLIRKNTCKNLKASPHVEHILIPNFLELGEEEKNRWVFSFWG
jgi:hypothetical protein